MAESVTPTKKGMVWGDTKGRERRKVSIPGFLLDDLARHVEGKAPDDLVFTGRRWQVLRAQAFQRAALTKAAEKVGVPGFHPHELRHSAASFGGRYQDRPPDARPQVGHHDLRYLRPLFPVRLDVVADAMDAARTKALSNRHPKGTRREPGEVIE